MRQDKSFKLLLSLGYFPKELPQTFTTRDFGNKADTIIDEWEKSGLFKMQYKTIQSANNNSKIKHKNSYNYNLMPTDPEIISKPKRGYERRYIHVTHPIPQSLLCREISNNINTIYKWLSKNIYCIDRISISDKNERSINNINFIAHNIKKNFIKSTSDWILTTDITRFYPSIYTHSIAWAAYGKEKVKKNIKLYDGSLAGRLDTLVRHCNRNQTVGIPIGPETSRIISEIISCDIDTKFQSKFKKLDQKKVDRLQDDWMIGINTLEEAEAVLSNISQIYKYYGLDINGSKTSISHILEENHYSWILEISSMVSHNKLYGSRLKSLLSATLKFQVENPNQRVVNYTLSIIEKLNFSDDDIDNVESFLLTSAAISPISIDRICQIIINLDFKRKIISKRRICERFLFLIEKNL